MRVSGTLFASPRAGRILVADDLPGNLDLLERMLSRQGTSCRGPAAARPPD